MKKLLCGLIGAGIQRSLTPAMQEAEALAQGLRLHYQLIDLDLRGQGPEALPTLLEAARTMGFAGLNITFPCKQAVIPLLDDLSDQARAMGAVNTVVHQGGRLVGHNTDGSGWRFGFERLLPGADTRRVVLLGAGGAGSAIAHAVLRMGAGQLVLVDSDGPRAQALADALNTMYPDRRATASTDPALALQGATGLIHATPTGMDKLPGLPLPAALLHDGPLGQRDRLLSTGDGPAEGSPCPRLPRGRWRRHGRGPGGGRLRAVHRPAGRCGAHGRALPAAGEPPPLILEDHHEPAPGP